MSKIPGLLNYSQLNYWQNVASCNDPWKIRIRLRLGGLNPRIHEIPADRDPPADPAAIHTSLSHCKHRAATVFKHTTNAAALSIRSTGSKEQKDNQANTRSHIQMQNYDNRQTLELAGKTLAGQNLHAHTRARTHRHTHTFTLVQTSTQTDSQHRDRSRRYA